MLHHETAQVLKKYYAELIPERKLAYINKVNRGSEKGMSAIKSMSKMYLGKSVWSHLWLDSEVGGYVSSL